MHGVDFNDQSQRADQIGMTWVCSVCGRERLCPYAAPCSGDPRQACLSCGDLLAHPAAGTAAVMVAGEQW